jgi:hypothetical protein
LSYIPSPFGSSCFSDRVLILSRAGLRQQSSYLCLLCNWIIDLTTVPGLFVEMGSH